MSTEIFILFIDKIIITSYNPNTMNSRLQIPANFHELLPELKEKTFKWRFEYSTRSENATIGHITHYSPILPDDKKPNGNIILAPGLASNADIEPVMKAITYWALTKNFNVYAITTFLGDFKPEITLDQAKRNTFPEFIKLMDMGIDLIEEQCRGQWTCLIGHSAGAAGAIEIFNKRVTENKTSRLSAAILFAPYCTSQWHNFIRSLYKVRNCPPDITDEEFANKPMGLISPHDLFNTNYLRYVTILPDFYDNLETSRFRPDLMAKYNIPITIVAGGRDRKSPIGMLRDIYQTLSLGPNGHLFKFIEFPNSKHSFIDQHKDYLSIIRLIQSQRIRRSRHTSK